jgi:hypothetical protein
MVAVLGLILKTRVGMSYSGRILRFFCMNHMFGIRIRYIGFSDLLNFNRIDSEMISQLATVRQCDIDFVKRGASSGSMDKFGIVYKSSTRTREERICVCYLWIPASFQSYSN